MSICFSAPDIEAVKDFATALTSAGYDPCIELQLIRPGDDIPALLTDGMARCQALLIVFSDAMRATPWVHPKVIFQAYLWLRAGKPLYFLKKQADSWAPALLRPFVQGTLDNPNEHALRIPETILEGQALAPVSNEIQTLIGCYKKKGRVQVEFRVDGMLYQVTTLEPADLTSFIRLLQPFRNEDGRLNSEPISAAFRLEFGRRMRSICLSGDSGEVLTTILDGRGPGLGGGDTGIRVSIYVESNQKKFLELPYEFLTLPGDQRLNSKTNVALFRRLQGHEPLSEPLNHLGKIQSISHGFKVTRTLSNQMEALGDLCQSLGYMQEAMEFYQSTLHAKMEHVAEGHFIEPEFFVRLHLKIGEVLERLDDLSFAATSYQTALSKLEEINENSSDGDGFKHNYSIILCHLARVHQAQGQFQEARNLYGKALEIRELSVKKIPTASHQLDLLLTDLAFGQLQLAMGEEQAAIQIFKKAIASLCTLTLDTLGPGEKESALNLATHLVRTWCLYYGSLNQARDVLHELGRTETTELLGTIESLNLSLALELNLGENQKALKRLEHLTAKLDPDSVLQHYRIVAEWHRGDHFVFVGQDEQARKAYETALALSAEVSTHMPGFMPLQRDRLHCLLRLSDLHQRIGNGEQFREYLVKAKDLAERLAQTAPPHWDLHLEQAMVQQRMSACYLALGRGTEALNLLQQAYKTHKASVAAQPRNMLRQRSLALTAIFLGDAYVRNEDKKKAYRYYNKALKAFEKIAMVDPERVAFQRDLALTLARIASFSALDKPFLDRAWHLLDPLRTQLPAGDQPLLAHLQNWREWTDYVAPT